MSLIMKLWNRRSVGLLAIVGALSLVGCGGDDEPSYPRSVTVEYKVTSSSGLTEADVRYTNETGGSSSEDAVRLPYSKKFTRSVKAYDSLALSADSNPGGALTTEILVDDKSVVQQSHSATEFIHGTVVHVFQ
jgi:hypothetical protein